MIGSPLLLLFQPHQFFTSKLATRGWWKLAAIEGGLPSAGTAYSVVSADTIVLAEVVSTKAPFARTIAENITFQEFLSQNKVRNITVAEVISFGEAGGSGQTHPSNISELLALSEFVTRSDVSINSIIEALSFNENLLTSKLKLRNAVDVLSLLESATFARIKVRNVSELLNFNELASRRTITNRGVSEVLPIIGGMTKHFGRVQIPIAEAEATVIKQKQKCYVQLQSLVTGDMLLLPCPIFGDVEANMNQQVVKRSMNNQLYVYSRRNDLQRLVYTFEVGRARIIQLEDFILANMHLLIDLLNWKGERWKVYMTSNPFDTTGKSRYMNEIERYDISLEFQGIRVV